MPRIILATTNPHKVTELRAVFADAGLRDVELLGLRDLPGHESFHEPAETGHTFEENATIKALSYATQTNELCLGDDSGLSIDALAGRPGVISSHYCTDGRETGMPREERDRRNNQRVLRELANVPPEKRTARFECVIALAQPRESKILTITRGIYQGRIGLPPHVPRGDHGFGYDPLFLVAPDLTRTSAQLPPAEKNSCSHRGIAARAMAHHIATLL